MDGQRRARARTDARRRARADDAAPVVRPSAARALQDASSPGVRTTPFDLTGKKVWVAGHRGMLGAALVRRLGSEPCRTLTVERADLDLLSRDALDAWMGAQRAEVVILAAGKVGGILANQSAPADFLYENLIIQANVVDACHRHGVEKTVLIGSSCIYPKITPQPIREDFLLSGSLEPTNEAYAVAKIAGIKLGQAYRRQHGCDIISAMPCNLYGPGDNFDPITGHVLPALIRRCHEAKAAGADALQVWGSGRPRREFLHVDDCADALVHLLRRYSDDAHVNVGSGGDLTIVELAELVAEVVGFGGRIVLDPSKPDGTPRKLMSSERLERMGWRPTVGLREGVAATYRWWRETLGDPQRLRGG